MKEEQMNEEKSESLESESLESESLEEEPSGDDVDWDSRVLCSDGNCIGVIGSNGRCKECGKPYEGDMPLPSQGRPEESEIRAEIERFEPADLVIEEAESASETAETAGDSDWEDRVLCSDGNCIGVIGPDGRCKECGKPYNQPADA